MLGNIPKLKAVFDVGDGLLSFYIDDDFICQWECDDEEQAEGMQYSFIEVFQAGIRSTGKEIAVVGHNDIELINE